MNNKDGELTEEEYREVIKYGGGMLINIIIGVVAAVAIAVYMGMLKKGVVFLMLLLPLRQYCGGYHMKNHNKCIVASIIIYFLQLMLIKNLKVTISVQIVMLIFALVIILMLAPVDNINNKMNYEEKNYLKKKIRVILIIELFLYAIFIVLSKTDYGLIVVLCIAIVAGLLILGNISNRIQERGEKYDIQDRVLARCIRRRDDITGSCMELLRYSECAHGDSEPYLSAGIKRRDRKGYEGIPGGYQGREGIKVEY